MAILSIFLCILFLCGCSSKLIYLVSNFIFRVTLKFSNFISRVTLKVSYSSIYIDIPSCQFHIQSYPKFFNFISRVTLKLACYSWRSLLYPWSRIDNRSATIGKEILGFSPINNLYKLLASFISNFTSNFFRTWNIFNNT